MLQFHILVHGMRHMLVGRTVSDRLDPGFSGVVAAICAEVVFRDFRGEPRVRHFFEHGSDVGLALIEYPAREESLSLDNLAGVALLPSAGERGFRREAAVLRVQLSDDGEERSQHALLSLAHE
jgi:hypothetical protein